MVTQFIKPDAFSRYKFVAQVQDDSDTGNDELFFGTRKPIQFVDSPDNTFHIVQGGDTLENIASRFFRGFPEPATLYWVIAEFQPIPIIDPTLRLQPNQMLIIPSPALVSNLLNIIPSEVDDS
jgi:nucleoid-associated protein YgaU